MSDSPKDKIKYGILKAVDISGFKVLDPPVRLLFGEEPQKQVKDIAKYLLLPTLFVSLCILIWHIAGPNHKTKSGEVPTPGKVLEAYADARRFDERENEKERAFNLTGQDRLDEIKLVEKELVELEQKAAALQEKSAEVAAAAKVTLASKIDPIQARYDALKAQNKAAKQKRTEALDLLAEQVASKDASPEALIALVKKNALVEEKEGEAESVLKDKMDLIRDNPPVEVKASQLAANKVEDEVQHYKKRLAILTKENLSIKREALLSKAKEDSAQLAAATTGKEALKEAKSVVRNSERAESTSEQVYARTATIFWQTKRSIATVFVGFIIAAVIAIPLGIMCGLNRIFMACMTPIISIFRPVSPVVWLLIFQIVIGAFFLPDPASHPLFLFMNDALNPLAFLQTNPAMIFSASTVAMCALWPALVNTALGVSAIDKDHLNVAKVLKLGFWSRLFKIVIPSSLPLVFAGLRISLGVGWMVLIAAEALSSSDGLGKFVWDEYQNGSSQSFANIILACFVVGVIGFFLDRLMIILQRLVSFDDGSATA
ncbi:ABC transporter permease subunit [Roseibacillus persicicus]|uniref:ABC transporter permease subunit n=1 Tax=Roseibacillus persicicus TaxID=454148 RepID=UPI00280D7322|nr:ABC transporter permease subunit [Roseibacillus persicicus]MDQ8192018.1 ABC transporter permease subunit [Roseibacillus persicicus]